MRQWCDTARGARYSMKVLTETQLQTIEVKLKKARNVLHRLCPPAVTLTQMRDKRSVIAHKAEFSSDRLHLLLDIRHACETAPMNVLGSDFQCRMKPDEVGVHLRAARVLPEPHDLGGLL